MLFYYLCNSHPGCKRGPILTGVNEPVDSHVASSSSADHSHIDRQFLQDGNNFDMIHAKQSMSIHLRSNRINLSGLYSENLIHFLF